MVNLRFNKVELECPICKNLIKTRLGKLVRGKNIKCKGCHHSVTLSLNSCSYILKYDEKNPLIDIKKSLRYRLN